MTDWGGCLTMGWSRDKLRTVHFDVAGVTRKSTVLRR
jgi:hypothetical protein